MSTSGVSSWALQRDAIINSALRKLAVIAGGSSPQTFEITNGAEALNAMIKTFHTDGMPVWAIKDYTFTTTANNNTYNIGNAQTLNTPAPLKVVQAYRIENAGSSNVPLEIKTHYDFNILPVNAATGEPVQIYYQPYSTYGVIKLWPTPIDSNTTIMISYQRPFEDMVASTDNIDFPSYWTEALIWGLAWRLSFEYGIPIMDRDDLKKTADFFHAQALSYDVEEGSMYIQPYDGQ